ncbi:hypothetical protein JYU34_010418 [Plutella xylostella]|uniref:LisH domain-containing protein n=1 Tax=Plutella xylostella TaxID=51655 RepID=A0ABQ7QJJ7_PLUXY|nr:hypothetical protein JYU34_010418 [Plutella xylostella]
MYKNMEKLITEDKSRETLKNEITEDGTSSEMFQAFMYDLFEKNGILNDVRAHLRSHIASVLKNAYSEGPLPCKKRFLERTQRTSQAINVLILEYLMRLEFNYSLSVFVSELPLNNMVFKFCKDVKKFGTDQDYSGIRFSDQDVFSIISHSGLGVDSEHTSKTLQMYKEDKQPLLLCILQCMPLFKETMKVDNASEATLSSSTKSVNSSLRNRKLIHKKRKRDKYTKLQKKYRERKKKSDELTLHDDILEDVNILERKMINEMFSELRAVYEAEVQQVRESERDRVRRYVAAYVTKLQEKQQKLEDSYSRRKTELESSITERKRFLCALTRRLAAAADRQRHTEEKIKQQLQEAEQTIRQRGEELREQITKELLLLVKHLDEIKSEKDTLNRERKDFENLRDSLSTCKVIRNNLEGQDEDWASKYKHLEQELLCIKSYIRSSASQQIPSESVSNTNATFSKTSGSLNNVQISEKSSGFSEEGVGSVKLNAQKVVNELKGRKNVNFSSQSVHEIHRSRAVSPPSEEGRPTGQSLLSDNEQLRAFSRQQTAHIEQLSSLLTRLQAELGAARSTIETLRATPARPEPFHVAVRRAANTPAQHISGAGEQLAAVAWAAPRVLLPGDTLPFVGVVGGQGKRHLMNQWRALRRLSPKAGEINKRNQPTEPTPTQGGTDNIPETNVSFHAPPKLDHVQPEPMTNEQFSDITIQNEDIRVEKGESQNYKNSKHSQDNQIIRKKSSREVLPIERMEFHLLRNRSDVECPNNKFKQHGKQSSKKTESPDRQSPSTVLREAKLRLKRLEIEADAVEQAYQEFRQRQRGREEGRREYSRSARENEREHSSRPQSSHNTYEKRRDETQKEKSKGKETNPYLDAHGRYKPACDEYNNGKSIESFTKPIHKAYTVHSEDNIPQDKSNYYLETPMPEFRKFYKSSNKSKKVPKAKVKPDIPIVDSVNSVEDKEVEAFVKKRMEELAWKELGTYNLKRMNAGDFADPEPADLEIETELKQYENPADIKIETDIKNDEISEAIEKVDTVNESDVEVPSEVQSSLPETKLEEDVLSKQEQIKHTEVISEPLSTEVKYSPRNMGNSPKSNIGIVNQSQNLSIFVSGSEVTQTIFGTNGQKLNTEMTVVVIPNTEELRSPKVSPIHTRSPEQEANITRTDVMEAIYNESDDVKLDIESEKEDEYGDDFDPDNYSGDNDFDLSPVSLPKSDRDKDSEWS